MKKYISQLLQIIFIASLFCAPISGMRRAIGAVRRLGATPSCLPQLGGFVRSMATRIKPQAKITTKFKAKMKKIPTPKREVVEVFREQKRPERKLPTLPKEVQMWKGGFVRVPGAGWVQNPALASQSLAKWKKRIKKPSVLEKEGEPYRLEKIKALPPQKPFKEEYPRKKYEMIVAKGWLDPLAPIFPKKIEGIVPEEYHKMERREIQRRIRAETTDPYERAQLRAEVNRRAFEIAQYGINQKVAESFARIAQSLQTGKNLVQINPYAESLGQRGVSACVIDDAVLKDFKNYDPMYEILFPKNQIGLSVTTDTVTGDQLLSYPVPGGMLVAIEEAGAPVVTYPETKALVEVPTEKAIVPHEGKFEVIVKKDSSLDNIMEKSKVAKEIFSVDQLDNKEIKVFIAKQVILAQPKVAKLITARRQELKPSKALPVTKVEAQVIKPLQVEKAEAKAVRAIKGAILPAQAVKAQKVPAVTKAVRAQKAEIVQLAQPKRAVKVEKLQAQVVEPQQVVAERAQLVKVEPKAPLVKEARAELIRPKRAVAVLEKPKEEAIIAYKAPERVITRYEVPEREVVEYKEPKREIAKKEKPRPVIRYEKPEREVVEREKDKKRRRPPRFPVPEFEKPEFEEPYIREEEPERPKPKEETYEKFDMHFPRMQRVPERPRMIELEEVPSAPVARPKGILPERVGVTPSVPLKVPSVAPIAPSESKPQAAYRGKRVGVAPAKGAGVAAGFGAGVGEAGIPSQPGEGFRYMKLIWLLLILAAIAEVIRRLWKKK